MNPENKDEDLYRGIYCHSDGYPTYNGKILTENYTERPKIDALVDLGDISVLRENVGEKHSFDDEWKDYRNAIGRKNGWTLAYHRDRGDKWESAKPVQGSLLEVVLRAFNSNAEYIYLWDDSKSQWVYISYARMNANGGVWYDENIKPYGKFILDTSKMTEWDNVAGFLKSLKEKNEDE
jgi:hypothetical protein